MLRYSALGLGSLSPDENTVSSIVGCGNFRNGWNCSDVPLLKIFFLIFMSGATRMRKREVDARLARSIFVSLDIR